MTYSVSNIKRTMIKNKTDFYITTTSLLASKEISTSNSITNFLTINIFLKTSSCIFINMYILKIFIYATLCLNMKILFCKTVNHSIIRRAVRRSNCTRFVHPTLRLNVSFFFLRRICRVYQYAIWTLPPYQIHSSPNGRCQVSLLRLNSVRLTTSSSNDHALTTANCPWIYRPATRSCLSDPVIFPWHASPS